MRVVLVDDHEIFRDGLRTVIESRPGATVVAEAGTARECNSLLLNIQADLLVLDLSMPGLSGLAVVRELRRLERRVPVLVLTMHAEPDTVAEAFAAGVTGFALKSESSAVLLAAIDEVVRGRRFLSPSLPAERINALLAHKDHDGTVHPLSCLSAREREVFELLMRGFDNEAIARELYISVKTVTTHRTHIFRKLDIHSIGELLRYGFRHGQMEAVPAPRGRLEQA